MTHLFFDCETAPTDLSWVIDDIKIEAPGNYKKPESIQKWMEENAEDLRQEAIAKTALDTSLAKIICIGFAVGDGPVETLTGPEDLILSEFFSALSAHSHIELIGHNIIGFDIPLVFHRAIINRFYPHSSFHMHYKPWDGRCFDTMTEWAGNRDRIALDKLCRILGIPGKGDINGSQIPLMYAEGRIEEIAEYCASDVERVRAVFQRMTQLNESSRDE